jgi:dolichol-phosphate mannosyltransferase
MNNILLVTPAYEEWDNLLELLPKVVAQLDNLGDDSRWVIVSESEITNLKVAETIGLVSKVSILKRNPNAENFAAAIQIGLNELESQEYIVFMDGDQSHDPNQIGKLISVLDDNPKIDIAISSRYIEGGHSENTLILRTMSKVLNTVFRSFLRVDAKDISTNFKAFRAPLLRNVQIISTNFEAVEELLLHCSQRLGRSPEIKEIPDYFSLRVHGVSKRKLRQFIGTYLLSLLILKKIIEMQNLNQIK